MPYGHSNLTYLLIDADGERWVLRRPPLGLVLPTAHDIAREYRIITALSETNYPVPQAIDLCEDESLIGSRFYVMSYVYGWVIRTPEDAVEVLTPQSRRTVAINLIDLLARLHSLNPEAAGLGKLGRREGYVARQLGRWSAQIHALDSPRATSLDAVSRDLAAAVPEQTESTLVHGDYRLDNAIVDASGRIEAVLDWELCTRGDPLADVGMLAVYHGGQREGERLSILSSGFDAPGFPPVTDLIARYGDESGRSVAGMRFYVAFGYWKLACILEGVQQRYEQGLMGKDPRTAADFGTQIEALAERAAATLSETT
jgi:aminoglycoside phosphotransferase (APT) family kinase protein